MPIDLLRRIQAILATANFRHPKIAPSHAEVMEVFPPDDHASGLHNLDFNKRPEENHLHDKELCRLPKASLIPWGLQHRSSLKENTYSDH